MIIILAVCLILVLLRSYSDPHHSVFSARVGCEQLPGPLTPALTLVRQLPALVNRVIEGCCWELTAIEDLTFSSHHFLLLLLLLLPPGEWSRPLFSSSISRGDLQLQSCNLAHPNSHLVKASRPSEAKYPANSRVNLRYLSAAAFSSCASSRKLRDFRHHGRSGAPWGAPQGHRCQDD